MPNNVLMQSERQTLYSGEEVLAKPSPVPSEAGLYAWYFRELPGGVPTDNCLIRDGLTLLYVGISPDKRSKPNSKSTLRKRIKSIGVSHQFSAQTFDKHYFNSICTSFIASAPPFLSAHVKPFSWKNWGRTLISLFRKPDCQIVCHVKTAFAASKMPRMSGTESNFAPDNMGVNAKVTQPTFRASCGVVSFSPSSCLFSQLCMYSCLMASFSFAHCSAD